MKSDKEKAGKISTASWIMLGIIIGICLFTFYTVAHPMYIYDTDDWTYIASSRHAWPSIKEWNPTKILPETLMPLTAEFGIRFIMPFTGDYIGSMAIAFALVTTGFIVIYALVFGRMLKELFGLHTGVSFLCIILFVLFHFLPFSVNNTGNTYLFCGGSVNCTFNYILPGLLNAVFVMWLMFHEKDKLNCDNKLKMGGLILNVYLCINSNMFHSIILASFAGMNILVWIIRKMKKDLKKWEIKTFLADLVRKNAFWLGILLVFCGSCLFEISGQRAARAQTSLLKLPIKETFQFFVQSVRAMNRLYLLSVIALLIVAVFVYLFKGRREQTDKDKTYISWLGKLTVCLIVTWIYLILLCAKVAPSYMAGNLVEFSWMFWFMLIGFMSFAYILVKIPYAQYLLPLCLYVMVFETIIDGKVYAENNVPQFKPSIVKELDENIISQMISADEAGLTDVYVYIPVHSSREWPMNTSYGGTGLPSHCSGMES